MLGSRSTWPAAAVAAAACARPATRGVCLNVNPARPGAAYGYVDMGGWIAQCIQWNQRAGRWSKMESGKYVRFYFHECVRGYVCAK